MTVGLLERDFRGTHPNAALRPRRSPTTRAQYGVDVDNDGARPPDLVAVLGGAVAHQLANEWYSGADLVAMRATVGLTLHEMTSVLDVDLENYKAREADTKDVQRHVIAELIAMSAFVADLAAQTAADVPSDGVVLLNAMVDQDTFDAAYPQARTHRDEMSYPVSLQHNAIGRVAGELQRQGRDVEVRRGDRRADLLVRRRAVGLGRKEAARLFGLNEKTYLEGEQGKKPLSRVLGELQAVDDFIATDSANLRVVDAGRLTAVVMGNPDRLAQSPPDGAYTVRDHQPFPFGVHAAAAGRRAQELRDGGHDVRVVLTAS